MRTTTTKMAAALLASALSCAPVQSGAPGDGSGLVTVATFTGTVDTEAGIFDIQVDPAPATAGRAGLVITEPAEVTVASTSPFFNTSQFCGGSTRATWGATITLTNHMASTMLAGTYAEITEFVGGTGLEACNGSATPPVGISGQYGAWTHSSMAAGASSTVRSWIFKYQTASRFTFRGRIVAAKVDTFASGSTIGANTPAPVDAGTYMVYADNTAATLWFVDATGAKVASTSIAARATSLAVDQTNGLIWYTTVDSGGSSWIGHVNLTGGGKVEFDAAAAWGETLGFARLATDPASSPARAFAYSTTAGEILYFDANLSSILTSWSVTNQPLAGLAVGPLESGGRRWIYGTATTVTATSGTMEKWSTDGGVHVGAWDVGASCAGPRGVILGPDGKMWVKTSSNVCAASTSGATPSTMTVQKTGVVGSIGLCTAPDGTAWSPNVTTLSRVGDATHDTYAVSVTGMTITGCSSGAGYLWGLSSAGTGTIIRYQP